MSAHQDYLAATAGLGFTKDFNDSLLAIMHDDLIAPAQRIVAWVKFRSWGKQREWCIRDDGREAHQSDCAAELKLHKSTISKTVAWLECRGYLALEGKLLRPSVSPVLLPPPDQKVSDSETFDAYLEVWKVANSATFADWQDAKQAKAVADATIKRCRLVALRAYREAMTAQQSAGQGYTEDSGDFGTEEKDERTAPAPEPVRPSPPSPAPEPDKPDKPDIPAPAAPSIRESLREFLSPNASRFGLRTQPDDVALTAIAAEVPNEAVLTRFCAQVWKQKPQPTSGGWRYFISVAFAIRQGWEAEEDLVRQSRERAAEVQRSIDAAAAEHARNHGPLYIHPFPEIPSNPEEKREPPAPVPCRRCRGTTLEKMPSEEICRRCGGTGEDRKPAESEHAAPPTARAKGGVP